MHNNNCISVPDITRQPKVPASISLLESRPDDSSSPTCHELTANTKDNASNKEAEDIQMINRNIEADLQLLSVSYERTDETSGNATTDIENFNSNNAFPANNLRKNDASVSDVKLDRTIDSDSCHSNIDRKEMESCRSDASHQHSRDSANSCEAVPEKTDHDVISHEWLTEENKICKILGLDRSALDPVVSVEKLEDRSILCEQSSKKFPSSACVLKTGDADAETIRGAHVEVAEINANIKREPAAEVTGIDDSERKARPCEDVIEEHVLSEGGHANKSDFVEGNSGIKYKKGSVEADSVTDSGLTETSESVQHRENSKCCVDNMVHEKESDLPCSETLKIEATSTSSCASDIIPKDEATKICDALLQTLSPLIADNEPEEKFIVSIKLDKLRKRVRPRRASRASTRRLSYAAKPHARLTRRNREAMKTEPEKGAAELECPVIEEDTGRVVDGKCNSLEQVDFKGAIEKDNVSSKLRHPKRNECNSEAYKRNKFPNAKAGNPETEADSRAGLRDSSDQNGRDEELSGIESIDSNNFIAKREEHCSDGISIRPELDNQCDEKRQKKRSKKYKMLPKRTTRHSRPVEEEDIPDKLIVSISLDSIDSYCHDEEKPTCLLSTHTYSEGWMVQEETLETESKKHFCIEDIFVDRKAFGVIKYRAVGDNGEVKERLEILESKVAPTNYIWPKDEDVRDTERLLVQSVAKEEKEKIEIIKKKAVEDKAEITRKVCNTDGNVDANQELAETVEMSTDSCNVEAVLEPNDKHEKSSSNETCVPISVAKEDTCPDMCHTEDSTKSSSLKRKVKDSKTREKNLEKASQNLAAPRKTRSQTARRKRQTSNAEKIDDKRLESKDNTESTESSSDTLRESQPPSEIDPIEKNVARGGVLDKIEHAANCGSVLPGDDMEKMEEDDIEAFSPNLRNDIEKDSRTADCKLPEGRIEQQEKLDIPQKTDTKKSGKLSKSRRRKADSSIDGTVDSRKVLRPRRGQHQPDSKPESGTAEEKIVCEDVKKNNDVDMVIDGELKGRNEHQRLEDSGDGLKVNCEQEDIASKVSDSTVLDDDTVKEPETSLPCVVEEKNSEAEFADKLPSQVIPVPEEVSEGKESENRKEVQESLPPLDGSKLVEAAVKCENDGKSEGVLVESKSEDDTGYNIKMTSKESSIAFSPVQHDSDKSDIDSFQNSPTRFQDEFGEMRPSSVATSIISSMATSLNSELFVMNSCDLEFTLPGMSKDVLVKANGNVVKPNEIEDCLRLPPADEKDDIDLPQSASLTCSEGVLHPDIGHRQSLLSSDMQMDCLSPYRDSSKFFGITPGEASNGDFKNVPQRINRDFQRADTFLTSQSEDSPFQQSKADVGLKASDNRSTEDKWDRVLMREPEGLIDKTQLTELVDDPFMNSNELRSSSNPDDSLLTEVENFTENDMANSPCDDGAFDIPDSQFENVDIPTEGFGQELVVEDPTATVNMEYTKETSEVYSTGSSTDEDDEDEDSDSSETDSDSSSSSTSSRTDDDDDDDDDEDDDEEDDDDDEDDSEEEDSESSDSESDINEELRGEEVCLDKGIQGGIPRPSSEASKEPFATVAIEEVIFQDSEIMPIERKECREFFMGKLSKTPEKYLEIRKFIINEWNKMRPSYLTKNSIRSKVDPTDANAVARVFMFLENIGAINIGCSVKNKWVERMERRRVKYFNAKRTENMDGSTDEQKRKRGRPPSLSKETQGREVFLDFGVITEEEKKANPQFFNGNKNKSPDKYLKMRNSIINCWMDSKPAYLTKQAARMAMSWYCGDVNAISRVHDYLEQAGVINFGCTQEPRRGRPSRGRSSQERVKPATRSIDFDVEREATKTAVIDSKATRMKNAQKKLEDISREVELEIGKPVDDCDISPYDIYRSSDVHDPNELSMRKSDDLCTTKPKLKRGRKPKIRQCEPDSTVLDENLLNEKDIIARPPKNGLIPGKEIWESGPASDKSSVGDSGFDSVSEISPLLESDAMILKPSLVQDINMSGLDDENDEVNYPMPSEEKIIDINMITQEEKLGCPEFFVGSRVKPPEKYVKIRDSILRSWHSKKPFYLNKHNARCDMPWYTGDINSIGRVHAFLERVGAINYQAVHRPKRTGRVPLCRKRKLTDSPRYEAPSPETEDDDEMSDKLVESDTCNEDLMTREERETFKHLLTDGTCVSALSRSRSTVQNVISEMWAKCKQKCVAKTNIDPRYADGYVDDGEDDGDDDGVDDGDDDDDDDDDDGEDDDDDSSSDVADDTFIGSRALMNGTYSETGKNGVWEMTKTFSLGLRPRKRWKMDINQDWIDRTESEGFTVKVCNS